MRPTEINVSGKILDKELLNFFTGWTWNKNVTRTVTVNFETCEFIAPYAITLFSAYILWLKNRKKKINLKYSTHSVAGHVLQQANFFKLLGEENVVPIDTKNRKEKTVGLTQITSSKEIPTFASSVMNILGIEDEELSAAVRYSLIELLRNVVQHSQSEVGGIAMAQFNSGTGIVEICVADTGLGIKTTINESYPEIDDDLKALKFAVLPHVSRTFGSDTYGSMKDNAGLGLFFIKQIASLSGGSFFLGSKHALLDIHGDKHGKQHSKYRIAKHGGWIGTFAYLQLKKDSIAEFDSILANCRKLASEAKKYPSELSLDFMDEIFEIDNSIIIKVIDFDEDVEMAAKIRDEQILPNMNEGKLVIIDFYQVKFATQSFIHALMYKIIKDGQKIGINLSIANCTASTREAIMTVAAYAKVDT